VCVVCVCNRDVSEEAMKMLLHRSNAEDEYLQLMLLTTGLGFRLQGLGFRLQGLGFRLQGLGFRL